MVLEQLGQDQARETPPARAPLRHTRGALSSEGGRTCARGCTGGRTSKGRASVSDSAHSCSRSGARLRQEHGAAGVALARKGGQDLLRGRRHRDGEATSKHLLCPWTAVPSPPHAPAALTPDSQEVQELLKKVVELKKASARATSCASTGAFLDPSWVRLVGVRRAQGRKKTDAAADVWRVRGRARAC